MGGDEVSTGHQKPNFDEVYVNLANGLNALMHTQSYVSGILGRETLDPTPENIRTYALALSQEIHEFINELGWKPWKAQKARDRARVLDEFADVLAFVGLFVVYLRAMGALPTDLAEAYVDKSQVNIKRLEGFKATDV